MQADMKQHSFQRHVTKLDGIEKAMDEQMKLMFCKKENTIQCANNQYAHIALMLCWLDSEW